MEQTNNETHLPKQCTVKRHPIFFFETLQDDDVKRRTGFETKALMIGMILIICNGDHDKMTSKVTTLTWLEEWVLYFEVLW